MSTREIASLLRAIADVIERNSLTEIEALTTALTQRSGNQRTKKPSDLGKPKYRALPDLSALASRILDAQDREEAKEILEREALTRTSSQRPHRQRRQGRAHRGQNRRSFGRFTAKFEGHSRRKITSSQAL
jgi:hypothetical protein